jgi:hypothetical protein
VTVDEYIGAADPDRREALRALREVIRDAAPQAREEIRHKMPYYVHHGDLVAFAAQKNHFSVYVMGQGLADHHHELGSSTAARAASGSRRWRSCRSTCSARSCARPRRRTREPRADLQRGRQALRASTSWRTR